MDADGVFQQETLKVVQASYELSFLIAKAKRDACWVLQVLRMEMKDTEVIKDVVFGHHRAVSD